MHPIPRPSPAEGNDFGQICPARSITSNRASFCSKSRTTISTSKVEAALKGCHGALIVHSHCAAFLDRIGIERKIAL